MVDEDSPDKRAIRRFALELPVTVTAASGEQIQATAKTKDVSSQGICFYCDAAMEFDSAIEFTLTLPAEVTMTEPISVHCRGKVVRVQSEVPEGRFAIAAAIDSYEFVADKDNSVFMAGPDSPPAL
jgi:hypothetical protein